jgi:hypothetical protein
MSVNIDLELSGFPVKIGDIELFFNTSYENLRTFFNAEEILLEKLKEAEEKAMHIHFPEDMNPENITDKEIKQIDAALDLQKESIAAEYDIMFGDGTFKKIYKRYPDIKALGAALEPLGKAIGEKLEEMEAEEREEVEKAKQEARKKQQAKQK